MKKIGIIMLPIIVAMAVIFWPREEVKEQGFDRVSEIEEEEVLHPLSIEALKNRQFEKQDLVIEREVRETSRFRSYVVSYMSDGNKLYALMNVPTDQRPADGWPVVVVNHGYIPPDVYSTENSYINTSAYFANSGFLVLKPDYRGHDKSEGEPSSRVLSRSEYTVDVLNLLETIGSIEDANLEQIFMYGHSMGGDIGVQILEISDKIKAASLWAPAVTEYPEQVLHFVNKRDPPEAELRQVEEEIMSLKQEYGLVPVSAIDNLDLISVPVNLHHGTADASVPYSWGEELAKKLEGLGKTVNFYSYTNDNHDIAGNWSTALNRDVELFLEN